MKFLRIGLTAFYSLFAAYGLGAVVMGTVSPYAIFMVFAYLAVAAALNGKGGKLTRWIAFGLSGVFVSLGILSFAMFVSTFLGHEYDRLSPVLLAIFGVLGLITFWGLKNTHWK